MSAVLGIDIGGTYIKAGVVRNGKIIKSIQVPSLAGSGKDAYLTAINSVITTLRKGSKITAIGLASPGAIDIKRGIVMNAQNTPQHNYPLREVIRRAHKLPVFLDNDANCFTLAEATLGAGAKYGIVAGITLGTGVGGGLVIDKKIYRGRNCAGEFGHITLDYNGWESPLGIRGGLEEYVGSRGIERLGRHVTSMGTKYLHQLADKKNKDAIDVWERYGEQLGVGLANVVYAVDPEIIVLGGQISKAWKYFHKSAIKKAQECCYFPIPPIVHAKTISSGILGAALLCSKR